MITRQTPAVQSDNLVLFYMANCTSETLQSQNLNFQIYAVDSINGVPLSLFLLKQTSSNVCQFRSL